jgi:HlyD family secretion protein
VGDTATLFRLVSASAIIGLLVYCSLHVFHVWRKRNSRPGNGPSRGGATRKLAWIVLFVGLVLLPSAWILRELNRSEGVLTGEDLFVVRASEDLTVQWLQERESVAAGEALAHFGSAPQSARADEARARLARAEAEEQVLTFSPLAPDPELTRRHQAAAQERAQAEQELGHAIAAAEAADRDVNAQYVAKKEALARLERTLTEKRKDLERATIRVSHARELISAYAELRARGTISGTEYQEQQRALSDATVEVAALAQELKDGLKEKELVQAHLLKLESSVKEPAGPLANQVAGLQTRVKKLQAEEAEWKARLEQDVNRCAKLREAEKAQAAARVREQKAGLTGLVGEQDVRAPFAGRIAFRAASPNAVRQRGSLLVLGPENGFLLTARLPQAEANALRNGGEVMLELGDDGPERRVPARFRGVTTLANEPEHAALQLECQPPPEVVRRLADGERLTFTFAWHPPLLGMWPFRAGILLASVGLVGLFLTRRQPITKAVTLFNRFAGPRPGPSVQGFGSRFREMITKGQVHPAVAAAVEAGDAHRPSAVATLDGDATMPDTLDELEESCRETLERLNRAESTEDATKLLDRLHRIRRALRALDAPINQIGTHRNMDTRPVAGAGS